MEETRDETLAKVIGQWHPKQPLAVKIRKTGHPEQEQFTAFAQKFSQWSDKVDWQFGGDGADLPGFALAENILYSALPLERELSPFLKGLDNLASPALSPEVKAMLDRIETPCLLTLYIALQCPHCPGMVEALIPMAAYCPRIRLHIIDGSLFPSAAEKDRVMAAPCLILDGGFRWTGAVSAREIISMVLNRDPSALSTATLKNILEAGDADWITREMMSSHRIFDGFLGLLLHETWSVRLGAMVVVETLAEEAPALALQLAPRLTAAFEGQDVPVQGDILYALGEIGDSGTADWIGRTVGESAHEDLKDAAQEAVESIRSRH